MRGSGGVPILPQRTGALVQITMKNTTNNYLIKKFQNASHPKLCCISKQSSEMPTRYTLQRVATLKYHSKVFTSMVSQTLIWSSMTSTYHLFSNIATSDRSASKSQLYNLRYRYSQISVKRRLENYN